MRYHFFILLILISILLCSCVSNKPFYNKSAQNWDDSKPDDTAKILHTVILAGDGRQAYLEPTLLNFLKIKMNEAGINSTTIFLGDNVQPYGLPDSFHRNWKIAEKSILVQLNAVKNYKGRLIFIPGNHDWAFSGIDGLKFVKNQRKFIENYLKRRGVFT